MPACSGVCMMCASGCRCQGVADHQQRREGQDAAPERRPAQRTSSTQSGEGAREEEAPGVRGQRQTLPAGANRAVMQRTNCVVFLRPMLTLT